MASIYDNMYYPKSYIDMLNQRRATTGLPSNPADLEAIVGADMTARYTERSRNRALNLQQESIDNQYELGMKSIDAANYRADLQSGLYEDALKAQQGSALIGAAVQAPSYLMLGYQAGKEFGWWGTGGATTPTVTATSPAIPASNSLTSIPGTTFLSPQAEATGSLPSIPSSPAGMTSFSPLNAATASGLANFGSNAATMTEFTPLSSATSNALSNFGATSSATPYSAYLGPFGAGFAGGAVAGKPLGEAVGGAFDIGGERERSIGGGIAAGAATGAAFGSVFPGVGTAVGAVVGGIAGGISQVIDDSVICTELHRQGLLPTETYVRDSAYGQTLPAEVIDGYHRWAKPLVRLMRKSKTITRIVRVLTRPVINEMAHRCDPKVKGSLYGKVVLSVGIPVCGMIGGKGNEDMEVQHG